MHSLMTSRPAITQNLLHSTDNKLFVPAEWLSSSYGLIINLVTRLCLGNMTGNLAYGKNSILQLTMASYQSITMKKDLQVYCLLKNGFLFEELHIPVWNILFRTLLCKPLHLPFLLDLAIRHLVVPSLIYYFEWTAWPS